MSHDEIQRGILDSFRSRGRGAREEHLEAHLASCAECAELAEIWESLLPTLEEGGETLFEPHPTVSELRSFARGEPLAVQDGVERHLAVCPSCALEVAAWERRPREIGVSIPTAQSPPRGHRLAGALRVLVALLAGVVLGMALLTLFSPQRETLMEGASTTPPAGLVPLVEVSPLLRGAETREVVKIPAHEPWVLLALPVEIPEDAADADRFRFSLLDEAGELRWSDDIPSSRLRALLVGGRVILLSLPTASLEPGRYTLRMVGHAGLGQREPALEVSLELAEDRPPGAPPVPPDSGGG